jgi:hypothetical protein
VRIFSNKMPMVKLDIMAGEYAIMTDRMAGE